MANGRKHFKISLETDVETDKIMRISDHLDVYWDSTSIAKKKKMLRHLFTEMKLPEPFRPHSESPGCETRLVEPAHDILTQPTGGVFFAPGKDICYIKISERGSGLR